MNPLSGSIRRRVVRSVSSCDLRTTFLVGLSLTWSSCQSGSEKDTLSSSLCQGSRRCLFSYCGLVVRSRLSQISTNYRSDTGHSVSSVLLSTFPFTSNSMRDHNWINSDNNNWSTNDRRSLTVRPRRPKGSHHVTVPAWGGTSEERSLFYRSEHEMVDVWFLTSPTVSSL